jgi:hypothetical protein
MSIQGCSSDSITDPGELATFHYRGEPIHPGAVQRLVGILADPLPVFTGIDLEGWSRSEDHGPAWTTKAGAVEWRPSEKYPDAYFEYRHVGRTPGGTHVIMTYEGGGGSGRFEHLLFVRFECGQSMFDGEPRSQVVMKSVGQVFLGDRQGGHAVVKGNKVIIDSWTGWLAHVENRTEPVEFVVD